MKLRKPPQKYKVVESKGIKDSAATIVTKTQPNRLDERNSRSQSVSMGEARSLLRQVVSTDFDGGVRPMRHMGYDEQWSG